MEPGADRGGLPLRMLVIASSRNLDGLHRETLLSDLHRAIEARGFEIIYEELPALSRYRDAGSAAVQRLCAAYLGGVIAEAFAAVVGAMPRPSP